MGRQVNFYLLPSDFAEVQAAIELGGPVRFLQDRTKRPEPHEIRELVISPDQMGKVNLRVYLARPQDLDRIKTRWIEQQQYWVIDSMDSPVIELDRCYYDGQLIRGGRIYFATDLRFTKELPSRDFDRWGRLIMNRIRRRLVFDRSLHPFAYISQAALDWMRRNGGSWSASVSIPVGEARDAYAIALAQANRQSGGDGSERRLPYGR